MAATKPDRRIERTRESIRSAFRDLLLERGYERLAVRDVIERANVGRSTFYEHFDNKEDVLYETLEPVLGPLADTLSASAVSPRLRAVLQHMWEQRAWTAAVLNSPAGPVMRRFLAALLEERLAPRPRAGGPPLLPRRFAASYLADAQLGLIVRWLGEHERCRLDDVAAALVATTRAAASALLAR